jgi:hypothetical protein
MAKMSDNLIGYGAAQVFDTSRSVNAYRLALAKKEKDAKAADEKFLKSLSVDSKGVRSVDVPRFTEKYNEFMEWAAKNQVDLKNPSKNPVIFQQFQQKKNDLIQDVARSKEAQATHNRITKQVYEGKEMFYNSDNVKGANRLHETSIYDDGFQDALSFQPGRDTNAALAAVPVKDLHTETTYENEQGVKTKTFKIKEDALDNAVDLFYNQYQMEFENDFDTEQGAKDFIKKNIKGRIKQDYQLTREGDGGGINIGIGGGSTGKVNYDVLNLSEQDAAAKYSDFGFTGAKEISFGFIKGENKPITFKDSKTGEIFEGVIPKAIILDPTTGSQGFVFYKPGKPMSESEIEKAFNKKKSELEAKGDETLTDEQINAQAQEHVESLRNGAEFSASNVPIGEINVHYDNLYDRLKEGGVFDVKKTEQTENTNFRDKYNY